VAEWATVERSHGWGNVEFAAADNKQMAAQDALAIDGAQDSRWVEPTAALLGLRAGLIGDERPFD
jgi:hypothetical protein